MGNSGERRFNAQLEVWAKADDPVLAEAAKWATTRINGLEEGAGEAAIGADREASCKT